MGMGKGAGTETRAVSSRDWNGDEDRNEDGNEDGIGEAGREAKKRKKPHKSYRRHVGMWETWMERGENVDKKGLIQ